MSGSEIVFTARSAAELVRYEDPPLGSDEVRGRTLATLISPGTELGWLNGGAYPIRPGYAAVFEVEAVGESVTGIAAGDRRFCMGAHRSTQQCAARHTLAAPPDLPDASVVIARLMGVSMTTLMTTHARPGDLVVVSGVGPVGFLAAHLFRLSGYEVVVVEPNAARRESALASGLKRALPAPPLADGAIKGKAALVVECSGHEQAALDACNLVRQGGEVVLVGVPWVAKTSLLAHEILRAVFFNYVVLRSGWEWSLPLHARGFVWEELYEGYNNAAQSIYSGFAKALGWLQEGRIPLQGLMQNRSPRDPGTLYAGLIRGEYPEMFTILDWAGAELSEARAAAG